jgi:hypothetical protein
MTKQLRRYTRPVRHVYFLRRKDGEGPIKVGCTTNIGRRFAELATWSPELLEVLATAPGSPADERAIHKHFAGARLHHEWFAPVPELLTYVAVVKQRGELPERMPIIAVTGPRREAVWFSTPSHNPEGQDAGVGA